MNNKIKKANYIFVFFIITIGIGLLACNSASTITVIGEATSNIDAMEALKKAYEQRSSFRVDFDKSPYEDFIKKANQDLSAKTGLYDIILQYPFALPSYVKDNLILKNSDYKRFLKGQASLDFEKDLFQNVWKEIGWYRVRPGDPEEPIGYPFAANTIILCYNRKLFEDPEYKKSYRDMYHSELSAPTDWNTFYNIAEFFGKKEGINGVCLQGKGGYWIFWEWCNFAFSFGGGIMEKKFGWESAPNTPLLVDSPGTIEATKFWLSLKPFNGPTDFFSTGMEEQIRHMRKGQTAMCLLWTDQVYNFLYGEKVGTHSYETDFGFAPIPGNVSMIAGGIYMVNKDSKNPGAAIEFIIDMLQPEKQVELMKAGLCSPIKSVYSDPGVQKLPYAKALYQSLERGRYMLDAGPDSDAIFQIMTKYLQMIWKGSISVEEGFKAARIEIISEREDIFKNLEKR